MDGNVWMYYAKNGRQEVVLTRTEGHTGKNVGKKVMQAIEYVRKQ